MSEQYSSPDVLAQRLDRALPPGRHSFPPLTSDPLVNTAAEIARLEFPDLSPNASARIERLMLATFNTQYRQRPAAQSRQPIRHIARWTLVASIALIFLVVMGLTPAVAASVPGEPLYGVKQFYERVELATAFSPSAKATVHLWHADRRTREALVLLERDLFDPTLIDAALVNIDMAANTPEEVRISPTLRAELLQIQTLMGFILHSAEETGLTTQAAIIVQVEKVQLLGTSDLLLPLPPDEDNLSAVPPVATPTAIAPLSSGEIDATATCEHRESCLAPGLAIGLTRTPECENGQSCLAPGHAEETSLTPTCERGRACLDPGHAEDSTEPTSTPRPTRVPSTRQPTRVPPTNVPPTQQPPQAGNNGGGNGNQNGGGNGNGGGNSGGNGNGGGNSNNNNGNGNNGGGNGNGNGNNGGGGNENGNNGGNGNGGKP